MFGDICRKKNCCLPVKASFLFCLLNPSIWVLIRAGQRPGGVRVAHPGPAPLILAPGSALPEGGGLARPQPALLPLFTEGLEEQPPVNTVVQWNKEVERSSTFTHTHTVLPWSWQDCIYLFILLFWKTQRGGKQTRSPSSSAADFWMKAGKKFHEGNFCSDSEKAMKGQHEGNRGVQTFWAKIVEWKVPRK